MHTPTDGLGASRFVAFSRDEWSRLRDERSMTLTESDLFSMRGVNEQVTLAEVEQIYLPLTRLLSMYFEATQVLRTATHAFLGNPGVKLPFVLGIGGSVAVGKSTVSRVLQTLLSQLTDHPRIDLVTTDGFLYPNAVLEERGMNAVMYAIDPRGVSAGNADQIQTSTIFEMYRSIGTSALRNEEVRAFGVVQTVAANTGGFAMLWRPNMSADFRRVVVANQSYYLIGYDAPAANRGKYHAIAVRVQRKGVQVRARSGYVLPAVP